MLIQKWRLELQDELFWLTQVADAPVNIVC